LDHFYAGSEVVNVATFGEPASELLLREDAAPWDGLELFVFADADSRQARLIARLDNLGKGASGAAVQSLNLMSGLPETAGLAL
jgi:N-acetyl-gamma-glutamyl-phosphate reductase